MQGADIRDPTPATMDRLAAALPRVERAVWPDRAQVTSGTARALVADRLRRFLAAHH